MVRQSTGAAALAASAAIPIAVMLVTALERFSTRAAAVVAVGMPLLFVVLAVPNKPRRLFEAMILFLPFGALNLPPRSLAINVFVAALASLALSLVWNATLSPGTPWRWRSTGFTMPLMVLMIVAVVSSAAAQDPTLAFYEIGLTLRYVLFYVLFLELVTTIEDLRRVCLLFLIGFIPIGLLGLAQFAFGFGLNIMPDVTGTKVNLDNTQFVDAGVGVVRAFATFGNSLDFAQYLLMPLFLSAGLLMYSNTLARRLACAAAFGLAALDLVFTLSRGTWFGAAPALAMIVFMRASKRLVFYGLAGAAIAAAFILEYQDFIRAVVPSFLADRVATSDSDFFYGRRAIWQVGLEIARDHPWLGVGLRNLYYVLPQYVPGAGASESKTYAAAIDFSYDQLKWAGRQHVESIYLTILDDLGIFGLLAVAFLFLRAVRYALRNYRTAPAELKPYALGVFGALVATLLTMISIVAYLDSEPVALSFWMLLAMIVVMQRLIGVDNSSAHPVPARIGAV